MSNASDFVIENGVLKEYKGRSKDVVIPEGVIEIGNGVLSYRALRSVVIPEGVTHISRDAFSGNEFNSVILPQSLQEIGANAFGLCWLLKEIIIPDNVCKIGSKAFNSCGKLENIVVGKGVNTIGSDAFKDTKWLKSQSENLVFAGNVLISVKSLDEEMEIPDGIMGIGASAFGNCKNLKRITIPRSVQVIGTKALAQCQNLDRVKIEGIPEIAKDAIPENAILIAKNIPIDSVKSKQLKHQAIIGYFFVDDAEENIPESISKYIAKNFDKIIPEILRTPELLVKMLERNVLQADQVDQLLEKVQGNAEMCAVLLAYKNSHSTDNEKQNSKKVQKFTGPTAAELKKIWKPKSLTDDALEVSCYSGTDTHVVVPDMIGKKQVTRIGSCCFYVDPIFGNPCQDILTIDIPKGVSSIGDRAFVCCKALLEIHISDTVKEIGEYAFWGCTDFCIYAPAGSYAENYAKENNIPFVAE